MDRNEKIIKLATKTGVSVEDATRALDACQDDILDAALYLEALGKVSRNQGSSYTTERVAPEATASAPRQGGAGSAFGRICGWFSNLIKKGNENFLDVTKGNECYISIPLTVFVILLIPFFWLITVLLLVGLFFDFHYTFRGPAFAQDGTTNQTLEQASKMCSDLKSDFKNGYGAQTGEQNAPTDSNHSDSLQ